MGKIGILNVGAGDTKLVFDNSNPDEVAKSSAIVLDMIRRGFVLLIEIGEQDGEPIYRRAKGFDPNTAEYIIAGTIQEETTVDKATPAPPRRRRTRAKTRVPAGSVNAVAVARTAGG